MQTASTFEEITAFFFDMDGVLTDGNILLAPDHMQLRTMNIKDGFALQLAVKKGYHVFVISGASSEPAMDRLVKLGVNEVHMGVQNKQQLVQDLLLQKKNQFLTSLVHGG